MAINLVTAAEMGQIDRTAITKRGIPALDLMERAGRAVADDILADGTVRHVGIVVGKGNNAGDGLVVARLLSESGIGVCLVMLAETSGLSEACNINYHALDDKITISDRHAVPSLAEAFRDSDVVVDAILGTGITGAPRGVSGEAIAAMNSLGKPITAIDLPSGLDADTGEAPGACIRAARTVTMGLPKCGMVFGVGSEMCGEIVVADIGFPRDLVEDPAHQLRLLTMADAAGALPARPRDGHKGTFGSLLVLAGSEGMSGAAYLTAATALRTGCGMVYAAFPERTVDILASRLIEAVKVRVPGHGGHLTHESWDTLAPYLEKADAIAIGPGIGTEEQTRRLVEEVACLETPMVIDADALNCLGTRVQYLTKREAPTVLTPHPGEMARLMDVGVEEVLADRIGAARKLASEACAVVLLKGSATVIAEPGGDAFINPTGNDGMAKGGSGDVLTGLIGGLLAEGCSGLDAACGGAYLHGLAGDIVRTSVGVRGMTASDTMAAIPKAFRAVTEKK